MPLASATRLGAYEIVAPFGAGGMGEVYRARDTRLGREVALKVLPPLMALDPTRRARFEQEARAAAALSHPNIVGLHDVGEAGSVFYIVSELVPGETLGAIVERGPVPVKKLLDIAVQIADGMAAAHAARITHRDLKPANIMVTPDGRAKIRDPPLRPPRGPARRSPATACGVEKVLGDLGREFAPASNFSPAIRFSLAPDGNSFVYSIATRHSNLWMFEGFQ
jgi:serine/threonine protein kinase